MSNQITYILFSKWLSHVANRRDYSLKWEVKSQEVIILIGLWLKKKKKFQTQFGDTYQNLTHTHTTHTHTHKYKLHISIFESNTLAQVLVAFVNAL